MGTLMNGGRVGAVLLIAATAVFGQDTVPFDSDMVIRSTTNLVQVRVVAEDANGLPATDLQRADFQIEDDKKPQVITLFAVDRGASSPGAVSKPAESAEAPAGYAVILSDTAHRGCGSPPGSLHSRCRH